MPETMPRTMPKTMPKTMDAERIIETAQWRTGRSDFGSDSFREGLEILVADANGDVANRPAPLMQRFEDDLIMNLSQRLKAVDYLKHHPELTDRRIERPVFVFGMPRTGTTLLSNLLNADPARRSPLSWEIEEPFPPVQQGELTSDPRALRKLEQERVMLQAMPEMGKYYRSSAIYPNECIFFMAHDLKALVFEARGKLPNYRDWLFGCDMTSAYEYHRSFLQILQQNVGGTWNLKMPSHALWLDILKSVYPDARLVWTHRDPFTALGSFCSIITLGHKGFTAQPDLGYIGENCTFQAAEHANRIMDYREARGEDSVIDVHYATLMRDPIAAMRRLYAALGDAFTPEAEAGMQQWLDKNPQGKFGRHEYRLGQYGLSAGQLEPVFDRYLSRYDIEREGADG